MTTEIIIGLLVIAGCFFLIAMLVRYGGAGVIGEAIGGIAEGISSIDFSDFGSSDSGSDGGGDCGGSDCGGCD